jgi:hypothetical protein
MTTRTILAAAAAALLLGACGEPFAPLEGEWWCRHGFCGVSECQRVCQRIRPQLIRDFGVLEDGVDCKDPQWRLASTCEECQLVLARDYGALLTNGCAPDGGTFIQPLP